MASVFRHYLIGGESQELSASMYSTTDTILEAPHVQWHGSPGIYS
jgi:hypothetical protein